MKPWHGDVYLDHTWTMNDHDSYMRRLGLAQAERLHMSTNYFDKPSFRQKKLMELKDSLPRARRETNMMAAQTAAAKAEDNSMEVSYDLPF